ncbi:hypothetical protein OG800_26500 [Streptomyces sp. NBC_00445]|uniref:hypothetical protein n=1 Tax=Streptomyces sp. NBC_00445 TaxID=2975745 RepID=UPI002E1D6045
MEVAELVLKYVEALAWPLVTVGLVWSLRNHIQAAFTRMTRLETPAGSIEFASDARETRAEAEELAADTDSQEPTPGRPAADQSSQFGVFQEAWDVAEASPIGALITAWLLLESISHRALSERGAMPKHPYRDTPPLPIKIIEALAGLGLSPRAVSVYHDLRKLRGRAVHGVEAVTPEAARDFVESARFVAAQVYSLPRPSDSGPSGDAAGASA